MTQPPYPPSNGNPTRRLALFVAALIVIVAIGSQPQHASGLNKSVCVCIPARAGLILKSAIAKTQARSTELFTFSPTVSQ